MGERTPEDEFVQEAVPDAGADDPSIQPGDVCLDLAQGRPVHVLADTGWTAAGWSEANDYDLIGNYGNSRLGTTPEDRVYDVVYCSSLKSEPSKTYAMPESRLGRVETEAADDGRPVADRVRIELLHDLFAEVDRFASDDVGDALYDAARTVLDKSVVVAADPEADDA